MLASRLTALACLSPLAALPLYFAAPAPLGGSYCAEVARLSAGERFDGLHQELFFAVLEGLYRDGVPNEVVDAVIATDPRSGYHASFVQGCPICMPSLNAFRTYRGRPEFMGIKVRADTFGAGLAAAEHEALVGADDAARRKALQAVIERWVGQRMDRLQLDQGEREAWRQGLEERRKKGMAALESLRESGAGSYRDMKACPLCEGAAGACKGI